MEERSGVPSRLVVICPVYNEADNIDYFMSRIASVFDSIDKSRYQCVLLFTNNRSVDATLERITRIEREHVWVNHITLSRNFGYQLSVLSGLTVANDADLYMVCDVDCEDPPELITAFIAEIEAGKDLAYGIRDNRPDSWLMLRCRRAFYFVLQSLGDYTIIPYMAEFAMMKRTVRDVIIENTSTFPFIRAEIGYSGFGVAGVPYRREARRYGETHYNYWGNARFAIAGILSSTTFPLRMALYSLPVVLVANVGLMVAVFTALLRFEPAVIAMSALNASYASVVLAFQSIYLARTYQNGLGRPRFIVDPASTNVSSVHRAPTLERRRAFT